MKRDLSNAMVFGVCSGLANSMQQDPAIIRTAFVLATIFGFGCPILIYLVLAVIMPAE